MFPPNYFPGAYFPGDYFTAGGDELAPAGNYFIEIWRSPYMIGPMDWELIAVTPESDDAPLLDPYLVIDSPLDPNITLAYRARRYSYADSRYSDWSPLLLIRPEGPTPPENTMGQTPTGSKTLLGIGLQPDEDTAVKVTDIVEYRSGSINTGEEHVVSEALLDSPSPIHKIVNGDWKGQGSYLTEMTPQKASTKLLTSLFGAPAETDVEGPPARKIKRWDHTFDRKYTTFVHKKDGTVNVYPFSVVESVQMRVQRGQREPLTATWGVRAGNHYIAATDTAVALDTATYDSLPPFAVARGRILIDDVAAAGFREFELNLNRNVIDEYCLTGKLGPAGFIDGTSGLDITLAAYFKDESHLAFFMGQASSPAKPYGFTGTINTVKIAIEFAYPNPSGYDSIFRITLPNCAFGALDIDVPGRDLLMQNIRIEPIYDGTEETDIFFEMESDELATAITTAGATIASLPTNIIR